MGFSINYLAVIVAAGAAFVFGFLWHGPIFGKMWLKLSGITEAQIQEAKKQDMKPRMAAAAAAQLVTAFVLAQFAALWATSDVPSTLQLAFWIWLGFIVPVQLNGVLWENKSIKLYVFNIVYLLLSLCIMALVIALMP